MKLSSDITNSIVDLLWPYTRTEDKRNTLIISAFSQYDRLFSDIDLSGSPRDFTERLVEQLNNYGEVEPGTTALMLLLKTLRKQTGLNLHHSIDNILKQLENIHFSTTPNFTLSNTHPTSTIAPKNDNSHRIFWRYILFGSLATLLPLTIFIFWSDIDKFIEKILVPTPTAMPLATAITIPTATPIFFPPRAEGEILLLISDLQVKGKEQDTEFIASYLKDKIRENIENNLPRNINDKIRVEYWKEPISEVALGREIGHNPNIDATFVLWGYRVPRTDEGDEERVYIYFEILQDEDLPILGEQYKKGHSFSRTELQIDNFKNDLANHWAGLTYFAVGLKDFKAKKYENAKSFFTAAIDKLSDPDLRLSVDPDILSRIYFYRGTTCYHLYETKQTRDDYRQALTLYESGKNLQEVRDLLFDIAKIYMDHDAWGLAKEQLEIVVEIDEKIDHPDTENAQEELEKVHNELLFIQPSTDH